jgi:hypothetical protein
MAIRPRVKIDTAATWARQIGHRVTRAVRPGPERRALKRRESKKTDIIRFMEAAGSHSAMMALTSRASIALALQLPVSELQPLLDELVAEERIFRGVPPLPPDHYSLSEWRPDWPPSSRDDAA